MRRATRTRASPAYPASRPDWGRCDASRNGRRGRGKRARWTWMEDPDGGSRERVRLARPEHHGVDLGEAIGGNVGRGVTRQERIDDHAPPVGFEREASMAV